MVILTVFYLLVPVYVGKISAPPDADAPAALESNFNQSNVPMNEAVHRQEEKEEETMKNKKKKKKKAIVAIRLAEVKRHQLYQITETLYEIACKCSRVQRRKSNICTH